MRKQVERARRGAHLAGGDSEIASGGGQTVERKKVLGHRTHTMAMHYAHADVDKMRAGMARIAEELTRPETVQ
jgi:hypothetical protein